VEKHYSNEWVEKLAKKKSKTSFRLPIGIAGIAIIFVVVYLFTGFPVNLIGAVSEQDLLDDINNLPPELGIPTDCIIPSDCEVIRFDDPPSPIDVIIKDCTTEEIPNTELLIGVCNNEVVDPFDNVTKIIDKEGTLIDPTPETMPELFDVGIRSKVLKIDGTGQIIESVTNFDIPFLAFFVEDTTNIDFTNGVLQQELFLVAPPNTRLLLTADFDILIGNKTALAEPLTLGISGVTDGTTGELQIDYINDAGLRTNQFTFQFKDNINKFPILGTAMVEFVISNVRVTSGNFEFELLSEAIYSLRIATDPNRLIIEDEFGGKSRILPTDDTLRIYSTTSTIYIPRRCQPRRSCSPAGYACCYVAPAMGAGQFTHILHDGTEEVLAEWNANGVGRCFAVFKRGITCTSFQKVNMPIQRGEIYRFDIGSPTPASITFKAPEDRKAFTFYCKGSASTSVNGIGYCNFQQASFKQAFADTLTQEPITFIGAPNG